MSEDLEIEFKNMLTKQEYISLLSANQFSHSDLKTQTNYYFDTPIGVLRHKKMGLRVRVAKNSLEFTLKAPTHDTHSYIEITDYLKKFDPKKELSQQISPDASQVLTYLKKKNIPISQLELMGELTTVRAEKRLNQDVLLVLDKSLYYGITDYEIEMEVSNEKDGQLFFNHYLKTHQIDINPSKKKISRMFEQKNKRFT